MTSIYLYDEEGRERFVFYHYSLKLISGCIIFIYLSLWGLDTLEGLGEHGGRLHHALLLHSDVHLKQYHEIAFIQIIIQ